MFSHLSYNHYQGPIVEAILNKYSKHLKEDINQIKDKSREWFDIDDSVPIGYTYDNLRADQQSHTGNQADDFVSNSSYMVEVDNFLQGKDNHLTHHPKYIAGAEFIEKGFPSVDQAKSAMEHWVTTQINYLFVSYRRKAIHSQVFKAAYTPVLLI